MLESIYLTWARNIRGIYENILHFIYLVFYNYFRLSFSFWNIKIFFMFEIFQLYFIFAYIYISYIVVKEINDIRNTTYRHIEK